MPSVKTGREMRDDVRAIMAHNGSFPLDERLVKYVVLIRNQAVRPKEESFNVQIRDGDPIRCK